MQRINKTPLGYDVGGSGAPHHEDFMILDVNEPFHTELPFSKVDVRERGWASRFEPLPRVYCGRLMRYLENPTEGLTKPNDVRVTKNFMHELLQIVKPGGSLILVDWEAYIKVACDVFKEAAKVCNWYFVGNPRVVEEAWDDVPAEWMLVVAVRYF